VCRWRGKSKRLAEDASLFRPTRYHNVLYIVEFISPQFLKKFHAGEKLTPTHASAKAEFHCKT
jgi:hypothetical protein